MDKSSDCIRMKNEFTRLFKKIRTNDNGNGNDKQIIIDNYIRYDEPNIVGFIKKNNCNAIILSGSEARITKIHAPDIPINIFKLGLPILGLCYGYELMMKKFGGKVATFKDDKKHSYRKFITMTEPFQVPKKLYAFCHHEYISALPPQKEWIKSISNDDQIWAAYNNDKKWLCLQFHPEVSIKSGVIFYEAWINWLKDSHSF